MTAAPGINTDRVPCPACGGTGRQTIVIVRNPFSDVPGKKRQRPCLACHETGFVEAARVCPRCHHFVAMCICPRSRIVEVSAVPAPTQQEDKLSGTRGVTWNEAHQRWKAEIRRDGKMQYLGEYTEKRLAIAIRIEAENAPTSEFPALKAKYARLRRGDEVSESPADDPAESLSPALAPPQIAPAYEPDDVLPAAPDPDLAELMQLVDLALQADRCAAELAGRADQAHTEADRAIAAAAAAWDRVGGALTRLAATSPSFDQSIFGNLPLAHSTYDE